jgi:hypothetical protein
VDLPQRVTLPTQLLDDGIGAFEAWVGLEAESAQSQMHLVQSLNVLGKQFLQ